MGLPSTPYFLCFHYLRSAAAHSHFSTSYTAHGLLFLSFWAPLSPFTSSRPICLSHGPVTHYSYRLGLMGFLSVCQLFSICVAGLLPFTWASEMAINKSYWTLLSIIIYDIHYNRVRYASKHNRIRKWKMYNFYENMKMNLDGFIWKLTLFCIFGEASMQFIQTLFPFYHIRTIKQSYNNLYFDNH